MTRYAVMVRGPETDRLSGLIGLVSCCTEFSLEFKKSGLEVMAASPDDASDISGRIICADKKTAYILAHYLRLQYDYGPLDIMEMIPDEVQPKLVKRIEKTPISLPS